MARSWSVLTIALWAAVWKSTPSPKLVGLGNLIFWTFLVIVIAVLDQYVEAGRSARFSLYGLNASVAWTAICLAIAALFVRAEGRASALATMMAVSCLAHLLRVAILLYLSGTGQELPKVALWTSDDSWIAYFVLYLIWWVGAMFAVMRSVGPRPLLRTAGLCFALLAASVAFPHWPAFRGFDFDRRSANYWEYVSALLNAADESAADRGPQVDAAKVELRQPALMESATTRLAGSVRGKTGLYAIGIAGWSTQDVFVSELDGALDALAAMLPIEGRIVRLVNHANTVDTTPIATRQNFAAAVQGIARVMDRDEDILLLFMTSHGSPLGVALSFDNLVYANLAPADVESVLDRAGIRNRIIIVSACYSGAFVKPLANENSIVITAASEDKPSFGCSNERKWTYFGDAFFNQSLRPGVRLEEAFVSTKAMIGQWEERDGLSPSNPQAYFGPALVRKLEHVYMSANRARGLPAPDRHADRSADELR